MNALARQDAIDVLRDPAASGRRLLRPGNVEHKSTLPARRECHEGILEACPTLGQPVLDLGGEQFDAPSEFGVYLGPLAPHLVRRPAR